MDEYELHSARIQEYPDDFAAWESLLRCIEILAGGILNRNTPLETVNLMRDTYDRFLARFPLLFGYWKKYADFEFSIAGTERAETIYERGVAGIPNSVDLWANYCAFKMETSHDSEAIRELFERGADAVGLDFLSHPFWDRYIEYEERMESWTHIYGLLDRIVHIPIHQYSRYFEKFTHFAAGMPVSNLLPENEIKIFREDIQKQPTTSIQAGTRSIQMERGELEIDREIRNRIHNIHLEIYTQTQTETTRRWTYEQEIKRPYFLVKELDESQLVNWRKYLEFEEVEGDYNRVKFLYERALVPCALYDEFWIKYILWMRKQGGKEEEVRALFTRASALFIPVCRPALRIQYALFEEDEGRLDVARELYRSILLALPGCMEAIINWAHMERRAKPRNLARAFKVLKDILDNQAVDIYTKGSVAAEWALLLWRNKGSVEEARSLFDGRKEWYLDSKYYFINYFRFEIEQTPITIEDQKVQYKRIKDLHQYIKAFARIPYSVLKDISATYIEYLLCKAPHNAIHEINDLKSELDGSFNLQTTNKRRLDDDEEEVNKRIRRENGHPGISHDGSSDPFKRCRRDSTKEDLEADPEREMAPTMQDISYAKTGRCSPRYRVSGLGQANMATTDYYEEDQIQKPDKARLSRVSTIPEDDVL